MATIDRLDSTHLATFYEDYVAKRQPCILTSIPDDLRSLLECNDFDVLAQRAGAANIAVEKISARGTFGSGEAKQEMTFSAFLKQIQAGEKIYLTTQYSEEDEDALFNEPLTTLRSSIHVPTIPQLAQGLVPAKINLWLGASVAGTSSGLHHDFHDNFYMLLAGQKRFRIFEPTERACEQLELFGRKKHLFPNGLITYNSRMGQDGVTASFRAQVRLEVRERLLAEARESGAGIEAAEDRYEEAADALCMHRLEDPDEIEDGEFSEGSDIESRASMSDNDDDEDQEDEDEDEDEADSDAESSNDVPTESDLAEEEDSSLQVPSFSKLSTEEVSRILDGKKFPGTDFVLAANELLYLPASYFHEVISSSANDDYHMAVNYWFYPPDGENGTYKDKEVLDELRTRAVKQGVHIVKDDGHKTVPVKKVRLS